MTDNEASLRSGHPIEAIGRNVIDHEADAIPSTSGRVEVSGSLSDKLQQQAYSVAVRSYADSKVLARLVQ